MRFGGVRPYRVGAVVRNRRRYGLRVAAVVKEVS